MAASDDLRAAAHAFALLDVATALAKLAVDDNYVRPEVDGSLGFAIEGGRHPVVEQALKRDGQPFIANACDLSPGPAQKSGQIWLITGPNMAGKSTFLRQNALIALLAQIGSFVPATRARIGIVDRLFSRVGAADDLARGRSTFMVEMVETAAILNQASERSLVILDEIGRGTATFDGLSIAWAAIEHLHETNRCRALFATHYHELTALSAKLPRLFNATVRVKEWQGDVVFLHEVLPGSADRSYGIQVAKLAGLPAPVIARAKSVLAKLEAQDRGQTARALVDDLPLFAVPSRAAAEPAPPSEAEQLIEAVEGAASRRDVAARRAGGAVCAEGEAAEAVTALILRSALMRRLEGWITGLSCDPSQRCEDALLTMRVISAQASPPPPPQPRFQPTQVISARLRPTVEPKRSAARCSTAIAMPKPIRPQAPLAITAAVARSADARMQDQHQAGEHDREQRDDAADLGADPARCRDHGRHQRRDQRGAQRNVVPAPRDQRHLDVAKALQQRQADRKGNGIGEQAAGERPLHDADQRGEREPHRDRAAQADQRAPALRQHDIGQAQKDRRGVDRQARQRALGDETPHRDRARGRRRTAPPKSASVATSAPITGPERSVMTDAVTTNAAVIAMRSTSVRMKASSGDISCRPCGRRDP